MSRVRGETFITKVVLARNSMSPTQRRSWMFVQFKGASWGRLIKTAPLKKCELWALTTFYQLTTRDGIRLDI